MLSLEAQHREGGVPPLLGVRGTWCASTALDVPWAPLAEPRQSKGGREGPRTVAVLEAWQQS